MSIVLDALRRGRGSQAAGPSRKSDQTDAVLHTLGYRQAGEASPLSQFPRIVAVLAAFALGAWVAMVWLT
jgi:hypothetical protein